MTCPVFKIKRIRDEEIEEAMGKIKTDSCGGPDFLSGKLLKNIYKLIPGLVNAAVRETLSVKKRHDRLVMRTLVLSQRKLRKGIISNFVLLVWFQIFLR